MRAGWVFQEMQVDTQPFPINTIEPTSKKILVRRKMDGKGKGKNITIGDPRTSNISQGEIAQKAPDMKTNKSGGTRGQAHLSCRARLHDSSIADYLAPTHGQSSAHADDPTDLAGQSAHGQRPQPPHKVKKQTREKRTYNTHGRMVKVGPTFDQLLSQYASKKVYEIGQQENPSHPLKQNGRIKQPER
jgi:hypothetical protein